MPIVAVSLIGDDDHWFTASSGIDLHEGSGGEAFLRATLDADDALVVPDARVDARFRLNRLVNGRSGVGFYAGQPLTGLGGHRLGVLSLLDTRPRRFSYADIDLLRDLADWVQKELVSDEELELAFQGRPPTSPRCRSARRSSRSARAPRLLRHPRRRGHGGGPLGDGGHQRGRPHRPDQQLRDRATELLASRSASRQPRPRW